MSDQPVTDDAHPATGDVPEVLLDAHLRDLRDHLQGAFPTLEASGYRGELTLVVPTDALPQVLAFAKSDPTLACEMLADVSAVHWPAGQEDRNSQETTGWPTYTETREQGIIEVDYILRSVSLHHWFRLRVNLPDDAPVVASATSLWSSAIFMEREVYDMMGVEFTGHPSLTRILMPDDWEGHPHRKDYPLGGVEVMYKGVTIPPPDEREY